MCCQNNFYEVAQVLALMLGKQNGDNLNLIFYRNFLLH